MKRIFFFLIFIIPFIGIGQTITTADTIVAKKGFKLGVKKVEGISNDTTSIALDSLKLITEWATKKLVLNNKKYIPAQFNPIAGTNITLSGVYPNITFNSTSVATGVSSVALTTPTGLTTTGSPITSSGTLAVSFTSGYSLPTTASQALWDAAYTNRITSATYPLAISSNNISVDTGRAVNAVATGGSLKKIVDSLGRLIPIAIDSPQQVLSSGNIAFTGTTAPSGSTANTYRWSRIGKTVTFRINMSYSVAATAITQVTFTFPSDMPLPENNITGYVTGSDNNSPVRANGGNTKSIINPLSANINYETGTPKIRVNTASQNIQYLQIQGSYFTDN